MVERTRADEQLADPMPEGLLPARRRRVLPAGVRHRADRADQLTVHVVPVPLHAREGMAGAFPDALGVDRTDRARIDLAIDRRALAGVPRRERLEDLLFPRAEVAQEVLRCPAAVADPGSRHPVRGDLFDEQSDRPMTALERVDGFLTRGHGSALPFGRDASTPGVLAA